MNHWRGGTSQLTGRTLIQMNTGVGYTQVEFGNKVRHLVHRLVGKAFLPNPKQKPCINHKDGDRKNNHYQNLEWCTYSENNKHAYHTLGKKPPRLGKFGKESGVNKSIVQLGMDGTLIKEWYAMKDAEREGGFDSGAICRCCKGESKHHKGYRWKYKKTYRDLNIKEHEDDTN